MELLLKNYPLQEVYHMQKREENNLENLLKQSQQKACVFGHFRFKEELKTKKNFLFTFLRSPTDRCISNFFHLRREGYHSDKPVLEGMKIYLKENELRKTGNWNLQTQFLAHTPGKKFFRHEEEYHVKHAIEHLHMMNFVGITEHFRNSVYMLGQSLNWRKWYFVEHNVNRAADQKKQILNEFRKELQEANSLDQYVYEEGLKLFKAQQESIDIPFYKAAEARALSMTKRLLR